LHAFQGIVCSGVAFYVQGIVTQARGPVFVTAFQPLCMIITTVLGSTILKEETTLGRYVIYYTLCSNASLINLFQCRLIN
jgi:hypothetical protein